MTRWPNGSTEKMPTACLWPALWEGSQAFPGNKRGTAAPELSNMRCRLSLRFRKQKIKRNPIKLFIQGSITRFGSYRDHPVGRVEKAVALDAQLTRRRSITRVIRATGLHVALPSHQIQELRMSRQKLLLDATNVTAWAIMPEIAPPG